MFGTASHLVTNAGASVINFSRGDRRAESAPRGCGVDNDVDEIRVDSEGAPVKNVSALRPTRPRPESRPLPFKQRGGVSVKEFHYRWEFDLRASPQALWPFVADTNRFNRDAGVPDVTQMKADDASSRGARRLRLSKFGVRVEWDEEPFEWIRPFRFGVVRRYRSGPVAEMRVNARLDAREGGSVAARIGGTAKAHQGMLRCASSASAKKIPIATSRGHGTGTERRASSPAIVAAETKKAAPAYERTVGGCHSVTNRVMFGSREMSAT